MNVDAWAPEPHLLAHLAPVWKALPESARGRFYVPTTLSAAARALGIAATTVSSWRAPAMRYVRAPGPVLVASIAGANAWAPSRRPIVLLNHGAGQTYDVSHPSYSGGRGRKHVALFLEPGPHAAEATRAAYPDAQVVEVGCPKLDAWHLADPRPPGPRPVVALSTHWACRVVPETMTTLPEWALQLPAIAAGPWDVLGHAHPRIADVAAPLFEAAGIPFVEDFDEVLDAADVYVCDNSSTLYEFASLGRPVVCINGAEYRRNVHHGLRFWDAVPGIQVDADEDIRTAISAALGDSADVQAARARAVARAYVACDGRAAQRAADAIVALMTERTR